MDVKDIERVVVLSEKLKTLKTKKSVLECQSNNVCTLNRAEIGWLTLTSGQTKAVCDLLIDMINTEIKQIQNEIAML